jgi:hypothetical protein
MVPIDEHGQRPVDGLPVSDIDLAQSDGHRQGPGQRGRRRPGQVIGPAPDIPLGRRLCILVRLAVSGSTDHLDCNHIGVMPCRGSPGDS